MGGRRDTKIALESVFPIIYAGIANLFNELIVPKAICKTRERKEREKFEY